MSRQGGGPGDRTLLDAGGALVLAAGLTLIAFTANSKSIIVDLAPNTWIEIVLVFGGCAAALAVLLAGAHGPPWGAVTLALFAALAGLSALSIAWSVAPDVSWMEAGRTAAYVCAFGGALALARLFPERWRALVGGIAILAVSLSGWAVLVKVLPASLDRQDSFGRLLAPFGYWNATGLMAALGLPACLWAGARRDGAAVTRALAFPAVALLVAVVALSYSRSALLAAVLGVAVWFAVVPTRLRGVAVLALGGAGGTVISGWALGSVAFTHDGVGLSTRVSEGHTFGLVLVAVLGLLVPVGFVVSARLDRIALSAERRHLLGTILIGLLALVPVAAIAALAASARGLTGEISHVWSSLTSTSAHVGDTPSRLVALANSRPQYWREGLTVGSHAPLAGVGAGGFQFAQTRYTNDTAFADYAHSYVIETFADLGLIGLALSVTLLLAWCRAAARTLARQRDPRQDRAGALDARPAGALDARPAGALEARPAGEAAAATPRQIDLERAGMGTLLAVVIAFGASSSIDWSWFIPGVALPALLCAGWLAGRGPLAQRVGLRDGLRVDLRDGSRAGLGEGLRVGLRDPGGRVAGAARTRLAVTVMLALAVLAAWMIWQPLRSVDDAADAMAALGAGDGAGALTDAQAAASEDPVAWQPLADLSVIYGALGNAHQARTELLAGVKRQPGNARAWYELGAFELAHGPTRASLAALQQAHELDLTDPGTKAELQTSRSRVPAPGDVRGAPRRLEVHLSHPLRVMTGDEA